MSVVIFGVGGHGRELMQIAIRAKDRHPLGFVVDDGVDAPMEEMGLPVYRGLSRFKGDDSVYFIVGVGSPRARKAIAQKIEAELGPRRFATLIDPSARVGDRISFSPGVVICVGAMVTENVSLGGHVHINTGAIVSHDCTIGDYSIVSPSATLCGNVELGEGVDIGAGATLIPKVTIGDWSVIGAGAVVTRNVEANCTAVGVPARTIKAH